MRVLRVDHVRCLAICVATGAERLGGEEIAIDLVEPVVRGQTLLVHAGVALANLEETDAALARPSARNEPPGRRAGKPHPPRSARARRAVVSSSERRA
jgi:hydrogenase maturation factor